MVRRAELETQSATGAATGGLRAWIEVDLRALAANVRALQQRCAGRRLVAVVKGDAYGHGIEPVARTVLEAGADELAVASAEEGAGLRRAGIEAEVMIIGPSLPADIPSILEHRLVPALAEEDFAQALDAAAGRTPPPDGRGSRICRVQIEVDSGLRRHGVDPARARALVRRVKALPFLHLAGLYTHFCAITTEHAGLASAQFEVFGEVLGALRDEGLAAPIHACNTLSSTLLPDAHFDALRIGGGLHGLGATARALGLEPTLSLSSRIALVRPVRAGDRVGYGGTHVCAEDTVLAVLPCGYADGLTRATWTGREVLVRGQRARIVGLVSMNQTILDVGGLCDPAQPGDEVVLLGPQGGDRVRAEERVPPGGSSYEVTTLLSRALPRFYRR
jgi:alanine racemase